MTTDRDRAARELLAFYREAASMRSSARRRSTGLPTEPPSGAPAPAGGKRRDAATVEAECRRGDAARLSRRDLERQGPSTGALPPPLPTPP